MDCRDIRKILESYIDNEVDRDMKKVIKLHLSSCDSCSNEYEELMSYKHGMDSLNMMKAPDNFLEEINRKIEKPPFFRQLIDKLFLPLNIKLPLEAAGVLATVVVIVMLYNPMSGPMKDEMASVMETGEHFAEMKREDKALNIGKSGKELPGIKVKSVRSAKSTSAKRDLIPAEKISKNFAAPPASAAKISDSEKIEMVTYEIVLVVNSGLQDYSLYGSGAMDDSVATKSVSREPVMREKKMGQARGASRKKSLDFAAKSGAVDMDSMAEEAEKEEPGGFLKDKKKKEIHEKQSQEKAVEEIIKITKRFNGKVIKKELNPNTRTVEYIVLDVPIANYSKFIGEIKRVGVFRRSVPAKARSLRSMQNLRIQLIDR